MSIKLNTLIKEVINENQELIKPERDLFEGFNEEVLKEEYPQGFSLEEFKKIYSYAGKVRYATQHLGKPIGQGSSRVVYKVDNTKVLKLAKNNKGLGQNEIEATWGRNNTYFNDIIAEVFDADFDKYVWVEMELATRATKPDFKRLWGVDFKYLDMYLTNKDKEGHNRPTFYQLEQEILDEFNQNEYVGELVEFMFDFKGMASDLGKLSSYGIVHRPMGEYLVVIDYGFNNDVWKSYYS